MAMKPWKEDDPTMNGEEMLTELEIEAAQQLMQLSEEDHLSSCCSQTTGKNIINNNDDDHNTTTHTMTLEPVASTKINDNVGDNRDTNNNNIYRVKIATTKSAPGLKKIIKLKKYRTIKSIYKKTKPLKVMYVKEGFTVHVTYPTN